MATRTKAIITCAPTGAIHTPSMSPHLPVTGAGLGGIDGGAGNLLGRHGQVGRPAA